MKRDIELVRKSSSSMLSVHYNLGKCTDGGEPHVRPKAYAPDRVSLVENERGEDITKWVRLRYSDNDLIHGKLLGGKRPRVATTNQETCPTV